MRIGSLINILKLLTKKKKFINYIVVSREVSILKMRLSSKLQKKSLSYSPFFFTFFSKIRKKKRWEGGGSSTERNYAAKANQRKEKSNKFKIEEIDFKRAFHSEF